MEKILHEALRYVEKGISIVPMTTYLDQNGKVKKKPLVPWEEFQTRRASHDEVRKWFKKHPSALIGGVTGNISNICVADADNPKALDTLSEFLESAKVPTSKTPRPGNHFFFCPPENCPGGNSTPLGLDFRGQNSLVILPPSINCQGKPYSWIPGLSLFEVDPPPLPEAYLKFIESSAIGKKPAALQIDGIKMFQHGNRDNSLFHTANCLVKGGMPDSEIYQVLENLIISWGEVPDAKWIIEKIGSARKRDDNRDRNLTQEIRDFFSVTSGHVRVGEIYQCIRNIVPEDRGKIRMILSRLAKDGYIERVGKEDGIFRRVETNEDVLDIRQQGQGEVRLWMPFGLENKVKILPKNIITIGGTPDGGKTAFCLNLAKDNRNSHKVIYFCSEMGLSEFQERVDLMGIGRQEWYDKIAVIERSSNFADVIRPEGLNIIDFLEQSGDDYVNVGQVIRRIWEKLTSGIAVICIQKRYGTDLPQGGIGSIEKARLALAFEAGKVKIVKAKNWRNSKDNPNGYELEFKLVDGWKFIECGGWTKAAEAIRIPNPCFEKDRQHKSSKKHEAGATSAT